MPDLDVSDVLLDPDFAQALTIKRRTETVGTNGRSSVVFTTVSPAPYGVILPQNDAPLVRGPDQQHLPALISVHTPYRLRSVAPGAQPDIVVWNGADYVVDKVYPFGDFGSGFVAAECSLMTHVGPGPA